MVCVHCGAPTRVANSRSRKRLNQIWRRRVCAGCGSIFTTEETVLHGTTWLVRQASGVLRPFSRDRLFLSLYRSLEHRSTAVSDAGALANTITHRLTDAVHGGVLDADTIEHAAEVALQRFNNVAGLHYQARHHKR